MNRSLRCSLEDSGRETVGESRSPRKRRYWLCPKCGRIYHRRKRAVTFRCRFDGKLCRPKRTFPIEESRRIQAAAARREARRQAALAKLRRRHNQPRTAYGSVLRLSAETRAAWRDLRSAKQRRSFITRGQRFLDALAVDLWSCPHQRGSTERSCDCTGGGVWGAPELRVGTTMAIGSRGQYQWGLTYGHNIQVAWDSDDRLKTLLHECVHWSDYLSGSHRNLDIGGHTASFFDRLEWLAAKLRYRLPADYRE